MEHFGKKKNCSRYVVPENVSMLERSIIFCRQQLWWLQIWRHMMTTVRLISSSIIPYFVYVPGVRDAILVCRTEKPDRRLNGVMAAYDDNSTTGFVQYHPYLCTCSWWAWRCCSVPNRKKEQKTHKPSRWLCGVINHRLRMSAAYTE